MTDATVNQRDIWWADFDAPVGSNAGFLRPVIIVQNNALNVSRLMTYLCVPLTSKIHFRQAPWNLLIPAAGSGLDRDSVAQTALSTTVDHSQLREKVGSISERQLQHLFRCLDIALGRT